ncbi:MAG: aminotransferase class V-fold PLP-dependent enzyme [Mollicutes bacterium PWAP]|nr:aminotransferase class V-fold PLP-dependent enzyme [Mollicutes bacterium PWAP]
MQDNIRDEFSIFELDKKFIYFDSASGTLKPKIVVDEINWFYNLAPINIHSMNNKKGVEIFKKIEETRKLAGELVGAYPEEVIFTSGTTDSLNKAANMISKAIQKDDEIILSYYNHISNILPWEVVAKKNGAKIIYSKNIIDDINSKTKIIAFSQMNNTIEQHINMERLLKFVKKHNVILVNDAAQAIVHSEVLISEADVIAYSGNKIYGPTGTGVLIIKKELLHLLKPSTYGGSQISVMEEGEWTYKDSNKKFEPGTINTAGLVGFGKALKWFDENVENNKDKIKIVKNYFYEKISELKDFKIISRKADSNVVFSHKKINSQDIVSYLGHKDIYLRSGEHCAKMLKKIIDTRSSIRASFGIYNTKEEVDKVIYELKNGDSFLSF